jgi:hypothetical protein
MPIFTTIHWLNGINGNWTTASDWSTGTVPGVGNGASLDASGSYTVTSAADQTVYSLTTIATATLNVTSGTFTVLNGTGAGVNAGVLDASGGTLDFNSGSLVINTGGTVEAYGSGIVNLDTASTYGGTLEALHGGLVTVAGSQVVGAIVEALGGRTVFLLGHPIVYDSTINLTNGGSIAGGTLTTTGVGVVKVGAGGGGLDGIDFGSLTTSANVQVADGQMLTAIGAIDNTGTIALDSTGSATVLQITGSGGQATLTGNGEIVLSDNANNAINAFSHDPATLTNDGNTISGAGTIGDVTDAALTLDNQAGTIDANSATNALTINTTNVVTNTGMLEATGAGGLNILDTVSNAGGTIAAQGNGIVSLSTVYGGTVEATQGGVINVSAQLVGATVEALGGRTILFLGLPIVFDSTINLTNGGTIAGGTLTTTGVGVVKVGAGGGGLDGIDFGSLTTSANIQVANGETLTAIGAIDNTGTIALNSTGNSTVLQITGSGGQATLTGNGKVVLSNDGYSTIDAFYGSYSTLINNGNTISGAGIIGDQIDAKLTLDNQAGAIDANSAVAPLRIETDTFVTNSGVMEATAGGDLIINDNVQNSDPTSHIAGTIDAAGSGSVVQFAGLSYTGGQVVPETEKIFDGTVEAVGGGLVLDSRHSQFETTTLEALGARRSLSAG